LAHFKGLAQLQTLHLKGTQITDGGLKHLKGLTQLRLVDLVFTKVTDAGAERLQKALPNVKIER
jgi:Leucine-rich repeat (LRR) protein